MDLTTLNEAAEALSQGGLLLVLFLIIVSGYKQKWVWGHQLEDALKDRDHWRDAYNVLSKKVDDEQRKMIHDLLQRQVVVGGGKL